MRYTCQNCDWATDQSADVEPLVGHLDQRVDSGEIVPEGECPECGALVHDEQAEPARAIQAVQAIRDFFFPEGDVDREVDGSDLVHVVGMVLRDWGFTPERGTCPNADCADHIGEECFPAPEPGSIPFVVTIEETVLIRVSVDAATAEQACEIGEAKYLAMPSADKCAAVVEVSDRDVSAVQEKG